MVDWHKSNQDQSSSPHKQTCIFTKSFFLPCCCHLFLRSAYVERQYLYNSILNVDNLTKVCVEKKRTRFVQLKIGG